VERVGIEPTWPDFQSGALTSFATAPKFPICQRTNKKGFEIIEAFYKISIYDLLYLASIGIFPVSPKRHRLIALILAHRANDDMFTTVFHFFSVYDLYIYIS